ncbi:MAG: xanthine dehydrogenase family protein subunit [Clostridiales bacterium]|jgi:CO/xanthine dehydrogenase FAD-binding subunit|nr:xanthine dehydrogenase family protein subunit [Clostridiales bacterium]
MEIKMAFQPKTVEEVKDLLSKYSNSKLLAGGTDLVLGLRSEKEMAEYLIDMGKIPELKNITNDEKQVTLGSMVTFTQLRESELIRENFNSLFECAKHMGSPQIRNAATIGGNIVNAGSAADAIPCIMSLNGILIIESNDETRQISCVDYFKNYSKEKINEKEILTKIIIPKKNEKSGYYKLGKRNALAIARINSAICLYINEGIIMRISLALGAVGRYPFRSVELEKQAKGKKLEWLYGDEALSIIENDVYESIKGRKTMPFKKEAIKGVYKEALRNALVNR